MRFKPAHSLIKITQWVLVALIFFQTPSAQADCYNSRNGLGTCLPIALQFAAQGTACPNENMLIADPHALDSAQLVSPFRGLSTPPSSGPLTSIVGGKPYILCDKSLEFLNYLDAGRELPIEVVIYLTNFRQKSCDMGSNYPSLECRGEGFVTGDFKNPRGLATDITGNLYIADTDNHRILRIENPGSPTQVIRVLAGSGTPGYRDSRGVDAQFNFPAALTVDPAGTIYVADSRNNMIRKITQSGVVTTVAGTLKFGYGQDGPGDQATFSNPQGIVADGAGNVFVADTDNHKIRLISPVGIVSTLAGSLNVTEEFRGNVDARGADARFWWPRGIAVDSLGNIYVTDEGNFAIRKIDNTGAVTTIARDSTIGRPEGIAIDSLGRLYVSGEVRGGVRTMTPDDPDSFSTPVWTTGTINSATQGIALGQNGSTYVIQPRTNRVIFLTRSNAEIYAQSIDLKFSGIDGDGAPAPGVPENHTFSTQATISWEKPIAGTVLRYSVCGPPTATSPSLRAGDQLTFRQSTDLTFGFFDGSETTPRIIRSISLTKPYVAGDCIGLQVGSLRFFTAQECGTLGGRYFSNGAGWRSRNPDLLSEVDSRSYGECLKSGGEPGSFSASLGAPLNASCPGKAQCQSPSKSSNPIFYNFRDGETFGYPLVRLYGNFPSGGEGTVTVTNLSTQQSARWPIFNDDYKAFVKLGPGPNQIQLNFNGAVQNLTLNYQPPSNPAKTVKLFFYLGSDGTGAIDAPPGMDNSMAEAIKRIQVDGLMLQSFYAETLKSSVEKQEGLSNLPKSTFALELNQNNDPIVHVVRGSQSQLALWTRNNGPQDLIDARTIFSSNSSYDHPNSLFLGYTGISHLDPATGNYRAGLANGGGGSEPFGYGMGSIGGGTSMIHSGNLIFHPRSFEQIASAFADDTPFEPGYTVEDSDARGNRWGSLTSTLGGWAHEAGHGLGLYHPDAFPFSLPNAPPYGPTTAYGVMIRDASYQLNRFFMVFETQGGRRVAVGREGDLGPSGLGFWQGPVNTTPLKNSVFLAPRHSIGSFTVNLESDFSTASIASRNGQVALSWTPASGADTYSIYYGTQSGNYPNTYATGIRQNRIVINGLEPSRTYFFRVRAYGQQGSDYQNSSSQANSTITDVPLNLTLNASLAGAVNFAWSPMSGNTYTLYRSNTAGPIYQFTPVSSCQSVSSSLGTCIDSSSQAGSTYYYVLIATSSGTNSRVSTPTMTITIPSQAAEVVTLIPEPKNFVLGSGRLNLSNLTQIIYQEPSLSPLAAVLSDEVNRITGYRLSGVRSDSGTTNGIRLVIDPNLANGFSNTVGTPYFPQRLDITSTGVVASGADYAAVAQATVSLLQLIKSSTDGFYLPISSLIDFSLAQYPGVMLDVARKATTLPELLQVVELCRLYKVRYLHLHLNDNEGFTFQSTVLPNLGSESAGSGPGPIRLSRTQLNTLIQYAESRGVTIVPELETVFHAGTMITSYPEIFGGTGSILNLANDEMYTRGLFPLIEEMCTVFSTSPYFHVGGDEADLNQLRRSPTYSGYLQAHALNDDVNDIYRFHMQRLSDYITRTCNKRVIAWEDTGIPGIITMNWHIGFYGPDLHGDVANLLQAGKSVIQVTWTPSTYTSVYSNFNWSPFDDLTPLGPNNLGSEMVLWELPGSQAVPYLRYKIPPRQERTYGYGANHRSYEGFSSALAALDAKLDTLLAGFSITESGVNSGVLHWLISQSTPGPFLTMNPPFGFQKSNHPSLNLGDQSPVSGSTIRYTTDGTNPNSTSNVATTPIPIPTSSSGITTIKAAKFDSSGAAIADGINGYTWQRSYRWLPFSLGFNGLVPATSASTNDGPQSATGTFQHGNEMQLFLFDADSPGVVRYSVCGPVTPQSPSLNRGQKLNIFGDSTISIGFFFDDSPVPAANWSGTFRQDYISPTCIGLQAGDAQTGIRLFTSEECSILGGGFRQNARTWQTQFPNFISDSDARIYGECLRPDVGSFSLQFRNLNATCPGKTPYLPPNACAFATDTASTGLEPARSLAQNLAQPTPQAASIFTDQPGVSLSPLLKISPAATRALDQVEPLAPSVKPAPPAIIFPDNTGCAEKYCLPANLLYVTSDKGCPNSASQSEQPWAWHLADAKRIDPNTACLMVDSLYRPKGTIFSGALNLAADQALYCDFWSGKFYITSGSRTFSNLGNGNFDSSLCERTQEYLYNYEKQTSDFTDGETASYLEFLISTDRSYPFPGIMK